MKPSRSTLPSRSWLVATVVPWLTASMSAPVAWSRPSTLSMPARNPSAGLLGVDGVLVVTSSPVSSSKATTSVNVPPVSMPIRIRRVMGSIQPAHKAARPRQTLPTNSTSSGNLCQHGTLVVMIVVIEGRELPGRTFSSYVDVHVALQVRQEPEAPVPGDATSAHWETRVHLVDDDFRGPAVHGRRGERFLYLTWGSPNGGDWRMFRRAKLMLAGAPSD